MNADSDRLGLCTWRCMNEEIVHSQSANKMSTERHFGSRIPSMNESSFSVYHVPGKILVLEK